MKRLYGLIIFLLTGPVFGVTIYVDPACPTPGNGSGGYSSTCDGTAAGNPAGSLATAVSASACGDTIAVRGVHSAHESCPGFDGRYNEAAGGGSLSGCLTIRNKDCSGGSALIVQSYGWTAVGAGTQEAVYLEGTKDGGSWTQCSTCSSGSCNGIPGTCNDVWWIAPGDSNIDEAAWAERPDGTPTSRQTAVGNVINRYDSYVPTQTPNSTLLVRWGSNNNCTGSGNPWSCCTGSGTGTCNPGQAGNAKPYIALDNGNAVKFENSRRITVRGFTLRDTEDALVVLNGGTVFGTTDNIVIQDNVIKYSIANPTGGDQGINLFGGDSITIDSNEIAYTGSEAIHTEPLCTNSATTLHITNNWIHHQGDTVTLGPTAGTGSGTPLGMILARSGSGECTGDQFSGNYSGSDITGNLIEHITTQNQGGRGVSWEGHADSTIFRDNIINDAIGACLYLHPDNTTTHTTNSNLIFNNLLINCDNGAGQGAVELHNASGQVNSNSFYNNTFGLSKAVPGFFLSGTGNLASNLIRNNIFYHSGNQKLIDWADTDASNLIENNDFFSATMPGGNTLVTWLGVNYTCAQINSGNMPGTDNNKCADPVFNSASDYHIQTSSPAKDAGTATGMPAGRTTDIHNTVAQAHGFANYSDNNSIQNGTWDMGVDEFITTATTPPHYPVWIMSMLREYELKLRP